MLIDGASFSRLTLDDSLQRRLARFYAQKINNNNIEYLLPD